MVLLCLIYSVIVYISYSVKEREKRYIQHLVELLFSLRNYDKKPVLDGKVLASMNDIGIKKYEGAYTYIYALNRNHNIYMKTLCAYSKGRGHNIEHFRLNKMMILCSILLMLISTFHTETSNIIITK